MDDHCAECGFSYAAVDRGAAVDWIRAEAAACAASLRSADARRAADRRSAGGWSAIDYGGHLRDVLITQRERVLAARSGSSRTVLPMGRDLRVDWGEYAGITTQQAADGIVQTAEWFAHSLVLLPADDWSTLLVYNYPEPAERSLEWLAAHTVHELVHHGDDIERLIGG
jgi:hypothetical protein